LRLPSPCRLSLCRGTARAGQFAVGEAFAEHATPLPVQTAPDRPCFCDCCSGKTAHRGAEKDGTAQHRHKFHLYRASRGSKSSQVHGYECEHSHIRRHDRQPGARIGSPAPHTRAAPASTFFYFCLKKSFLPVGDNAGANIAAALKNAHNRSLILAACRGNPAPALTDVHVPRFAANECFVCFHFSAEFTARNVVMRGLTNAVHHKPSRFLSNSNSSGNLARTDAVLAIAKHPESAHPLIQSKGRILKDRSHFERELLLTSLAEPDAACPDERVFLRAAAQARNCAIRPAKVKRVLKATLGIAEVDDRVLKCLWRFHGLIIRQLTLCVKYIVIQSRVISWLPESNTRIAFHLYCCLCSRVLIRSLP